MEPVIAGPIVVGGITTLAGVVLDWWLNRHSERERQEFQKRFQEAQFHHEQLVEEIRRRAAEELEMQRQGFEAAMSESAQMHQLLVQRLDQQHALFVSSLEDAREQTIKEDSFALYNSAVLYRLEQEAILLTHVGYDVIYELVEDGYGLALPLQDDLILAFWIPPRYPAARPGIFLATDERVESVYFDQAEWDSDYFLIDIVDAIVAGY